MRRRAVPWCRRFVGIVLFPRRERVGFPEANVMSFGGSEQGTALREQFVALSYLVGVDVHGDP